MEADLRHARRRCEAAFLRQLNGGTAIAGAGPMARLHLREPRMRARLSSGSLAPVDAYRRQAEEVDAELRTLAGQAGSSSPLTRLAERFSLSTIERQCLQIIAAYELDLDTRALIHGMSLRPNSGLALELLADILPETEVGQLLACVHGSSPLRLMGLVRSDGVGLAATLSLRRGTLDWLCGDERLPHLLQQCAELVAHAHPSAVWLSPEVCAEVDGLRDFAGQPGQVGHRPLLVIHGPRGGGRLAVAQRLAHGLGRDLLVCSVDRLVAIERATQTSLLPEVLTEAITRSACVVLADAERLTDEGPLSPPLRAALAQFPDILIATVASAGRQLDWGRTTVSLAVKRPTLIEREQAWQFTLDQGGIELPVPVSEELAAHYVVGAATIAGVVAEARRAAHLRAQPVDASHLEAALGRRLSLNLGSFGTVISRKARFSEMVLPVEVVDSLRDMIAMIQQRALIFERWGYQRHLGLSRGVSALFSGEPGTGKTMAASVIASELGLELVRIDLATVVSKFVGETEKNLAHIFDEAQDAHAMLLFDEADSLFGKRTEIKSAQDRFANLEVNYILQRMESFDGICVLTTNLESSIDQALQRRLNFRVRFPAPELEERERLWRQMLPPEAAIHGAIDFRALAERFAMTGGYIKNAVVRAAVIAARSNRSVAAEDLWAGALNEYAEMGKVMPSLADPG
jgi:hypothetical protein